jgi:hypothetical protein
VRIFVFLHIATEMATVAWGRAFIFDMVVKPFG